MHLYNSFHKGLNLCYENALSYVSKATYIHHQWNIKISKLCRLDHSAVICSSGHPWHQICCTQHKIKNIPQF